MCSKDQTTPRKRACNRRNKERRTNGKTQRAIQHRDTYQDRSQSWISYLHTSPDRHQSWMLYLDTSQDMFRIDTILPEYQSSAIIIIRRENIFCLNATWYSRIIIENSSGDGGEGGRGRGEREEERRGEEEVCVCLSVCRMEEEEEEGSASTPPPSSPPHISLDGVPGKAQHFPPLWKIIKKREKHTTNKIKKVHVTVYVCVWVSGCLCGCGSGCRCGVLALGHEKKEKKHK